MAADQLWLKLGAIQFADAVAINGVGQGAAYTQIIFNVFGNVCQFSAPEAFAYHIDFART